MTGGELLIKEGDQVVLFKIRHDGYVLEEYFIDMKKAFIGNLQFVLDGFLDFYRTNYESSNPDMEIDTDHKCGYFSKTKKIPKNESDYFEIFCDLENEIESKNDEDGFLCGYSDYTYFIDLDSKRIYGAMDDDGNPGIYDENYKFEATPE